MSSVSPVALLTPRAGLSAIKVPRLPGQQLFTFSQLEAMSPVAFKAYDRISDQWRLSGPERHAVIGADAEMYAVWKESSKPLLTSRSLERVSVTLGIYRRLAEIYGVDLRHDWIRRSNTQFDGRPPLEAMSSPDVSGIYRVRDYLLEAGGGWF